ncbi:tetratricopeptide repeat protein [Oleisolibacter albus]|uniref:tetratricopeptide repeat protein n=1 Tax=Oleisolibacter albus TaxID=2171757 RepID=UPI0013904FC0|nr:tetratricopeptide repeat protein [Oleisolibacter albus]
MSPPAPAILALLQTGLAAQKAGRLDEAERCFRRVLAMAPGNPDALQLLGLLAKAAGRLEVAADLMRQSLRSNRHQPHVLNNLGNILLDLNQPEMALAQYRSATQIKPDYVEAWFNQSEAFGAMGDYAQMEKALRRVLDLHPGYVPAITNLGSLLNTHDRAEEAETVLRFGLSLKPRAPKLLNNLGLTLKHQGRYEEALLCWQEAVTSAPAEAAIWLNLGNGLAVLDRHEEAVDAYRHVLALSPRDRNAHANLNKLLWRLDRTSEVLASYRHLKGRYPHDASVLEMSAEAASHFNAVDEALTDAAAAERLEPSNPQILRTAGYVLLTAARPQEALAKFEKALGILPKSPPLLRGAAEAALRMGQVETALTHARSLTEISPYDQMGLALEALALRLLGDPSQTILNDYKNCVAVVDIEHPPPGYDSMAAFNAALAQTLASMHTTRQAPVDQTLRNGTQTTENLFGRRNQPAIIQHLRGLLMNTIGGIVARYPDDPTHPFLGRKSTALKISGSWSVRLQDQGFHLDHIHSAGWISACYYVVVPDCAGDPEARQGWLKFGEPNLGPELRLPYAHAVQPKPGRLVVFPSYVWHGTIPFHSAQHRMTVAFDIVPV